MILKISMSTLILIKPLHGVNIYLSFMVNYVHLIGDKPVCLDIALFENDLIFF